MESQAAGCAKATHRGEKSHDSRSLDRGQRLVYAADRRIGRGARSGAGRKRFGVTSAGSRFAAARKNAPVTRADETSPQDSGDRHAGRLWRNLACPGVPADGRLVTLEIDPRHAEIAVANIAQARLAEVVELRLGPALETLPKLAAGGAGPFDLIFIDADKPSNPDYFRWALKLSHPAACHCQQRGAQGRVIDPASKDENVLGVRGCSM